MAENVVVPVTDSPKPQGKHFSKKWLLLLGIVIVLLGIGAAIWQIHNQQVQKKNDAFIINGKQYSKTDVKAMTSFVVSEGYISQSKALSQLYTMLKTQTAAQQVGITPTTSEINIEYQALDQLPNSSQGTVDWYKLNAFINALPQAYAAVKQGDYSGYSFAFEFGLRIEAAIHPSLISGYGNQTLIAQDKSYASQQANYYYNLFKANKIKPDKLISAIDNDQRIAYNKVSSSFDTQSPYTLQDQVGYPSIVSFIEAQTKSGLSTIQTGKVETSLNPTSPKDYADGLYFFTDLTKASLPVSNPQQVINNAITKLHTTYYGL